MTGYHHKQQGERLKKIRKHLDLTQVQMAERLGITQAHLSTLESGKYAITIDLMATLKGVFPTLMLDWLVTGEGDMCNAYMVSLAAEPEATYTPVDEAERLKRIEAFLKANFPDYN